MKKQTFKLICACLAGFAYSANYTNHAPLAGMLMKQFVFSKMYAGFLTTGIFTTHAIMQIPGGHFADKYGGKKTLIAALSIIIICNAGLAFSTSYEQLLIWKILVGFGTGIAFVSGSRYLTQVLPQDMLLKGQGFYGASILMGSGFVIFAVPRVAQDFGWSISFLTTAGVALAVLVLWLTAAPKPELKPHPHVSLGSLLSHGQLWLLGLVQMSTFGVVLVIGSWVIEMLKVKVGLSPVTAGTIGSLVLLLGIFTRVWGGTLILKLGYRWLLILSLFMIGTGAGLLAITSSSFALALTAIVIMGFGAGLPYAALFNRAVALFPGRGGAAMGLVNMIGLVMILAGAPLVGKIAEWTGNFSSAFLSMSIFAFAVMFASLGIKSEYHHHHS